MVTVLKTVGSKGSVGSNPTVSCQFHQMQIASHFIGVDDLESTFDGNRYIKSKLETDRNCRAF
jgi:hypothetical protein